MLNTTTRISLHVLIFEAARPAAMQIEPEIQRRFPNSLITRFKSVKSAQQSLQDSVYDLVILNLYPLRPSHEQLLKALKNHDTPMPVVMVVDQGEDERVHGM